MFKGKKILVLGLSKSGTTVAKILNKYGAVVTVNEIKERSCCEKEVVELENLGIEVVTGFCDEALVTTQIDFIVKNPGIPYQQLQVAKAVAMQIPVFTEIEIAYRLSQHPIIGITGTNGKTTTTMLVHQMLAHSHIPASLAGNIGYPLVEKIDSNSPDTRMVTELSSFQLMGIHTFRPHIGCLLNITPAHQDYHQDMEEYAQAKLKLFRNQNNEDYAIVPLSYQNLLFQAKTYYFSIKEEVPQGVMVKNNHFVFKHENGKEHVVFPVQKLKLPGIHNMENAAAAICIAVLSKANPSAIEHVLQTFEGAEHRLEWIGCFSGASYYNDSKATNPLAVKTALDAFDSSIIHIAGGKERGDQLDILQGNYQKKVKAGIYLGETSQKYKDFANCHGIEQVYVVSNMSEAVSIAKKLAHLGDIVLLSPGCASWDMYTSFEERGNHFKQEVKNQSI